MKHEVIYPSRDTRLPFNMSLTFDVSDDDRVVELLALGLPSAIVVIVERGIQADDCADLTWFVHNDPCCEKMMLSSTSGNTILSIPGKYRVSLASYDGVSFTPPSMVDVEGITIIANHFMDRSGAIRVRHNCCAEG